MVSGRVVAFHSYKGGTGKTTCIVNLAALFAGMGKKVCLIDFDVYAPSLSSYFDASPRFFVHDLLLGDVGVGDVLVDYSRLIESDGELHIAFSSPSKDDIHGIEIAYDNNFQLNALRKFLAVKKQLLEREGFDYVFIDTSPGIRYWSINALAAADVLFVMLKINNMDISGTKKMMSEIYEALTRYGLKTFLILNKVPGALPSDLFEPELLKRELSGIEETLKLPIFLSIPCFCDIQFNREEFLWALQKPDHPFSKQLREIPSLLSQTL